MTDRRMETFKHPDFFTIFRRRDRWESKFLRGTFHLRRLAFTGGVVDDVAVADCLVLFALAAEELDDGRAKFVALCTALAEVPPTLRATPTTCATSSTAPRAASSMSLSKIVCFGFCFFSRNDNFFGTSPARNFFCS